MTKCVCFPGIRLAIVTVALSLIEPSALLKDFSDAVRYATAVLAVAELYRPVSCNEKSLGRIIRVHCETPLCCIAYMTHTIAKQRKAIEQAKADSHMKSLN